MAFLKRLFFFNRGVLGSQQNWVESTDFPYISFPYICTISPILNILYHSSTIVTVDEPILTYHNHPKSIIYFRVHSWCGIFYGFGKVYNDMYSLLEYHAEWFHCPKNSLCPAYSSSPLLNSCQAFFFVNYPRTVVLQFHCSVELLHCTLTITSSEDFYFCKDCWYLPFIPFLPSFPPIMASQWPYCITDMFFHFLRFPWWYANWRYFWINDTIW